MTTSAPSVNVLVSPSVPFTAGEIYQRRNDSALRVVGALMGSCTVKPDSSVDIHIRQCFVVPHSEVADQISINSEYYKQRSELFKKCYGSQQQIVGWFSIGEEGAEIPPSNTGFINDSFGREVSISGASSGLNVHLDMAIAKDADSFKYGCTVTDVKSKTQSVPASCRVEFKASEAFAVDSVFMQVIQKPAEKVYDCDRDGQYRKAKMSGLDLGALLKEEERQSSTGPFVQTCDAVRKQLDALADIASYQAF